MKQPVRIVRPLAHPRRALVAPLFACAVLGGACSIDDATTGESEQVAFAEQALDGYSLSAPPSSVTSGSPITVAFVAPSGHSTSDWVGIYPVGAAIHQYVAWAYVPAGDTGNVTVTLPESAIDGQQYELRYVLADYTPAANSAAFTATAAVSPYQFPNGPYATPAGHNFWVDWDAPANHSARDWIGLYRAGAGSQYVAYAFVGAPGATSGSLELKMPNDAAPGESFEVRWMLESGGVGGRSAAFQAGSGLTGPTGYLAADTDIVASWSSPASHATNDWIGVVPFEGDSTEVYVWSYVGSAGATSGDMTLHLPADMPDGAYELRYFLSNTYEISGISAPFNIGTAPGVIAPASASPGSTFAATWNAPVSHSANDWIGLYKVGAASYQLEAYSYVGAAGQGSGSVNIRVPSLASGTYELRYNTNNSYNVTATSASFPVSN